MDEQTLIKKGDANVKIELRSIEIISEISSSDTLELYFHDEEDFLDAKSLLSYYCFIAYPALDADYRSSEIIGQGA